LEACPRISCSILGKYPAEPRQFDERSTAPDPGDERERVRLLALEMLGQLSGQEPGQRHDTAVVRLGRAQHQSPPTSE
jgi:hypothetical protein